MRKELSLPTEKMIAYSEDGVGWMIFNNPERLNAISLEMTQVVPVILGAFADDQDVRVVVMTGAGDKAFISGGDISQFGSRRSTPEQIEEYNRTSARAGDAYRSLGKPLIAMIRGYALGGGLAVAMKADLRIASDDSRFGIPAVRLGLGYDFRSVKDMVDLIGPAQAREILLTGSRIDAATALRIGLVNRVVPGAELEAAVSELTATIVRNAPLTMKAILAAVQESLKDESERDTERVANLVAACFASEDYIEGRTAFMEKRQPAFKGR